MPRKKRNKRTPLLTEKIHPPGPALRGRIDFVMDGISADDASGTLEIALKPDPHRYEWRNVNGEECLYDRLDNLYISQEAYSQLASQLNGAPIRYQPPTISNIDKYLRSRTKFIRQFLEGAAMEVGFEDKSEEFLQSLSTHKLGFVIMSLDIVDSTKLATTMPAEHYARLITAAPHELSEIIPKFRGHVLKYTGDGLIAYFPEPSFFSKNDLAVYCASTVHALVSRILNPVLKEKGFPEISIRIGLDAGEACVVAIGSSETKRHADLIGVVVNLATKIQARAKPGEILLGDTVERNAHGKLRTLCSPVDLPIDWEYMDPKSRVPYKIHRLDAEWRIN